MKCGERVLRRRRRALRELSAAEWCARIEALPAGPVARAHVGSIVWWDYFGSRLGSSKPMAALVRYCRRVGEALSHGGAAYASPAEVQRCLEVVGYPACAARRKADTLAQYRKETDSEREAEQ